MAHRPAYNRGGKLSQIAARVISYDEDWEKCGHFLLGMVVMGVCISWTN